MKAFQIDETLGIYFVTFTVNHWIHVFNREQPVQILMDSLRFCINNKGLRVLGYVLMPNHFHGIIYHVQFDSDELVKTITSFRKYTGSNIVTFFKDSNQNDIIDRLSDHTRRDRRIEFWQPGWQAEGISSESFFQQKLNYMHQNPVRKGWVDAPQEWKYSSAGFWLDGEEGVLPIHLLE